MLGVKAPSEQIRSGHEGQFVVGEKDHGDEEFFGVVQLLGSVAALGAALDGTWQLREMEDTKVRLGMLLAVSSERTGDGFRSDQAKVVQVVGPGGMGIIRIDDVASERGTILRDAVKMVLVGERIEFRDESAILLEGRFDDENIEAALERSSDHLAPFGFVACAASRTVTITRKIVCTVSFLKSVFDFLRGEQRPVLRILNAV